MTFVEFGFVADVGNVYDRSEAILVLEVERRWSCY